MSSAEKAMADALLKRDEQNALRRLITATDKVDFCSNDYLGFAASEELYRLCEKRISELTKRNGSGGSRLLAGNTRFAEELETYLAKVHEAQDALMFNSGYDANLGLFSCVPGRGDTILYDELVHASIHDGMRLSRADSFLFQHNDLEHLKERLQHAKGNVFVVVESVYSMDGDSAPLKQLVEICKQHSINLIVDEAHATGVFGYGLVQQLKLQNDVFARIHTFGKAMGCHGAAIVGSTKLKQYLINYARSFIYTTALPLHSLVTVECAYKLLEKSKETISALYKNVAHFKKQAKAIKGEWIDSDSAIQSLVVPGNEKVRKLAAEIQAHKFDVRPILNPTVPKGKERIRICLHSFNTAAEIDGLLNVIASNIE